MFSGAFQVFIEASRYINEGKTTSIAIIFGSLSKRPEARLVLVNRFWNGRRADMVFDDLFHATSEVEGSGFPINDSELSELGMAWIVNTN